MRYFIYETTNAVNGKRYRGVHSTEDENDDYLGSGKILLRAVRKYGKTKFKREFLEECVDEEEMWQREAFWVDSEWVARHDTYNLKAGGAGRATLSEESKRAIGDKNKGRKWSQEQRRKHSERMRGHVLSEESRRKLSESKKGSRLSAETRRRIGDAKRGVVPSKETRQKLSEAGKGRVLSDETKQKIKEKATGRQASEETKQKLRDAWAAHREERAEKTRQAWKELKKNPKEYEKRKLAISEGLSRPRHGILGGIR